MDSKSILSIAKSQKSLTSKTQEDLKIEIEIEIEVTEIIEIEETEERVTVSYATTVVKIVAKLQEIVKKEEEADHQEDSEGIDHQGEIDEIDLQEDQEIEMTPENSEEETIEEIIEEMIEEETTVETIAEIEEIVTTMTVIDR